jgi:hypothetical protein
MFSKQMYANTSASAVPAPCKISEVRKKKAITPEIQKRIEENRRNALMRLKKSQKRKIYVDSVGNTWIDDTVTHPRNNANDTMYKSGNNNLNSPTISTTTTSKNIDSEKIILKDACVQTDRANTIPSSPKLSNKNSSVDTNDDKRNRLTNYYNVSNLSYNNVGDIVSPMDSRFRRYRDKKTDVSVDKFSTESFNQENNNRVEFGAVIKNVSNTHPRQYRNDGGNVRSTLEAPSNSISDVRKTSVKNLMLRKQSQKKKRREAETSYSEHTEVGSPLNDRSKFLSSSFESKFYSLASEMSVGGYPTGTIKREEVQPKTKIQRIKIEV